MEKQPFSRQAIGERIGAVSGRASERIKQGWLHADNKNYESVEQLVDSRLHSWDWGYFSYDGELSERYRGDKNKEPDEVKNTKEILSLPTEVLDGLGAKTDMLRGYLARYQGDNESAIQYFEQAQFGFLQLGDTGSYATTSAKLARTARDAELPDVAEKAHRNAIHGYQLSQEEHNAKLIEEGTLDPADATPFSLASFYEYRRLAKTLGTPAAVSAHGTNKLKALRQEVLQLNPVAKREAVYGVLALMQIEKELAKWSRLGGYSHERRARHYGFICSAANLGGVADMAIMLITSENGKVPPLFKVPPLYKDSVEGWASTFAHNAPGIMLGRTDYYREGDDNYW